MRNDILQQAQEIRRLNDLREEKLIGVKSLYKGLPDVPTLADFFSFLRRLREIIKE